MTTTVFENGKPTSTYSNGVSTPIAPPQTPPTPQGGNPAPTTGNTNPTPTGNYTSYNADGTVDNHTAPTTKTSSTQPSTQPSGNAEIDSSKSELSSAQTEYQAQSKLVQNTITGIQNGAIPLNAGEQAQVESLKQSYQALIDQQKLTNTGAAGSANVRGYQTGAAEYDPSFQVKTIGSIVTAGQQKVATLNTQMAGAVAKLTQGFHDSDISAVKDAWTLYQDASKERTTAIQKTIDDANKVIKDAQDAKLAADKVTYDRVTKPINDIAMDAAKNGAPKSTIDAIKGSEDVTAATSAAGDYLQTGSGTVGEWLAYKRELESEGKSYLSYNSYATMDANRKAALTRDTKPTADERKSQAYGTINQLLASKNSKGVPYLDNNGYFTPQGFKDIVTNAAEDNISRQDIINQYGSYLFSGAAKSYGLTPKETKDLGFT